MSIRFGKGKKHKEADFERLVAQESLILEATEEICRILETENISRSELARRLGKSKAFVTQVLSGERNMTLNTAADLAFALGHRFHVRALRGDARNWGVRLPLYLSVGPEASDLERTHWSAARPAAELSRTWIDARADLGGAEAVPDHEFSLSA